MGLLKECEEKALSGLLNTKINTKNRKMIK